MGKWRIFTAGTSDDDEQWLGEDFKNWKARRAAQREVIAAAREVPTQSLDLTAAAGNA